MLDIDCFFKYQSGIHGLIAQYGDDSFQSQSSTKDLEDFTGLDGEA